MFHVSVQENNLKLVQLGYFPLYYFELKNNINMYINGLIEQNHFYIF
jgi:hypothetical protein